MSCFLGAPRWLVTADQMRALDEATIQGQGVPGAVLMENAGRGVVEVLERLGLVGRGPITVACGPGNNGGDGWVVARQLHLRGAQVTALRCADEVQIRGDARLHHDAALRSGVRVLDATAAGLAASPEARAALDGAPVIVDALLGTGTARAVEGHLGELIRRINAAPAVRVAVDLPSGLDADRGTPLGICVEAHHTVTIAFAKIGMAGAPGFLHAGTVHVIDIGIPWAGPAPRAWLLGDEVLAPLQAPRPRDGHKGTFGHLLIVAGSRGKTGAALLAGEAAARAGAGLVTIASPDEAQAALASRVVEVMTAPLGPEPLDEGGAWMKLAALLVGKAAVAFGPGVPRTASMRGLLGRLLGAWDGPLVIDADGLNLLAEDMGLLGRARAPERVVLTPHPAEMGRLAGVATAAVQADRVGAARELATRHRVTVLLKGARTVIAAPDGRVAINPTGNPGMGSGGTGDVLTGVIGALAGMGRLDAFAAAQAGAYLHGAAGDLAAMERGEAGLVASDIIEALPRALMARAARGVADAGVMG